VSPVAASIYCSPHPAALQIDPPPGSGSFASMISRPENCFTKMIRYLQAETDIVEKQIRPCPLLI
jgi:hypothetical protein